MENKTQKIFWIYCIQIIHNQLLIYFTKWNKQYMINGIKNGTTNSNVKRWKIENEFQKYFEYIAFKYNTINYWYVVPNEMNNA